MAVKTKQKFFSMILSVFCEFVVLYRGVICMIVYYWNRSIYNIDLRPAFWTSFFPSVASNLPIVSRKTATYSYYTVGKSENNFWEFLLNTNMSLFHFLFP
jgi:hypothetical protein